MGISTISVPRSILWSSMIKYGNRSVNWGLRKGNKKQDKKENSPNYGCLFPPTANVEV